MVVLRKRQPYRNSIDRPFCVGNEVSISSVRGRDPETLSGTDDADL
jgi:hypothetical protein